MRLQKLLSQAGVASRRAAEEMIRAGRVRVNGAVVSELGTKVEPGVDQVEVDGRAVRPAARVWIAVYKPRGVVSTRRDPGGRATVYDTLPRPYRRLFHVGRLDQDSEGLMLLTNDGDSAHRLLHPRYGIERVYEVEVKGRIRPPDLRTIVKGVQLEDGWARAESASEIGQTADGSRLRLTLREGRKREVRRMLDAVGHPVTRLVRTRYGSVSLGDLEPGAWRVLEPAELRGIETGQAESPSE